MSLLSPLRKLPSYGSITGKVVLSTKPPTDVEALAKTASDLADGGSAAWLTVFGAFLALFCSFGQMNAFGTFQSWYTTHQLRDLHPSTVAWIGSVQLWFFFFSVRETSYTPRGAGLAYGFLHLGWFHRPRVRRVRTTSHYGAGDRNLRDKHAAYERGRELPRLPSGARRSVRTRRRHVVRDSGVRCGLRSALIR